MGDNKRLYTETRDLKKLSSSNNNFTDNIREFLSSWEEREGIYPKVEQKKLCQNHINIDDNIHNPTATIYTWNDQEFFLSVESGVQELVKILVFHLGCITYSSCQGHLLNPSSYRMRNIGMLPRTIEEKNWIYSFLTATSEIVNVIYSGDVNIVIEYDILYDKNGYHPTIEINFKGDSLSPERYFVKTEPLYSYFCFLLTYWLDLCSLEQLFPNVPKSIETQWKQYDLYEYNATVEPSPTLLVLSHHPKTSDEREYLEREVKRHLCNVPIIEMTWKENVLQVLFEQSLYLKEQNYVEKQLENAQIVIIQNHAWALYAWLLFLYKTKQFQPNKKIFILHIDCHPDMETPLLSRKDRERDFKNILTGEKAILTNLQSIAEAITSSAIGPGNYILPFLHTFPNSRIAFTFPSCCSYSSKPLPLPHIGKIVIESDLILGLVGKGLTLQEDHNGSIILSKYDDNEFSPTDDEFWILDIDCDYFCNSHDNLSDIHSFSQVVPNEQHLDESISNLICALNSITRKPDLVTIAISPDFCPISISSYAVKKLVPGLQQIYQE